MSQHILESTLQDIRYGARTLVRSPAFSAIAVLTLAVGIGGTPAACAVLDTVVWRAVPYAHPELLQTVFERSDDGSLRIPSYPTFRDWQAQNAEGSSATLG